MYLSRLVCQKEIQNIVFTGQNKNKSFRFIQARKKKSIPIMHQVYISGASKTMFD